MIMQCLLERNKTLSVVVICLVLLAVNCDVSEAASLRVLNAETNSPLVSLPTTQPSSDRVPQLVSDATQPSSVTSTTAAPIKEVLKQNESTTVKPSDPNDEANNCPELSTITGIDDLTQDEFVTKLTDGCRYDRLIKPPTNGPLPVDMQIDMKHIESSEQLQFKSHILVQLHYRDSRLAFSKISPNRANILGEEPLRNKIWVPHLVIYNERESSLMGIDSKDVFVQISPSGDVIYSYRMTTTFYCWMNLQKFPFDYQICQIQWISWAYNTTNLVLHWKKVRPFQVAYNLHLTEFVLEDKWVEEIIAPASFNTGGLAGNATSVVFKFKLRREVGYYIMDYFLPSILLVMTSWVTFWLQVDAAAPRVTLGTATMLSFITLNGGLSKSLPKQAKSGSWPAPLSYFAPWLNLPLSTSSGDEGKEVELKKQNSKHILKGALTPSLARKQLRKAESINSLYKTRSCSSLDGEKYAKNTQANYLTVHSFPSSLNVPTITTQSQDELVDSEESVTTIPVPENSSRPPTPPTWTTMTPQEVAIWIDKKSRVVFPVAFFIFNLFYWSFVYAL
ncbi:hypothetical protein NQ317_015820 [Molorchus minor]|uniref:Uncharacterized protein n=1 Tax=Molorchus minor TaxID=1323400 RepID=A0ABQ9JNC6_9CUCU|nr:hypothetical protein NQ317_015820 [Molorchus minor]